MSYLVICLLPPVFYYYKYYERVQLFMQVSFNSRSAGLKDVRVYFC